MGCACWYVRQLNQTHALCHHNVVPTPAGAEVSHQEFLNLVNQARAEAGVAPVQYAPDMDPPALSHSQEMAQTGDFTHTGGTGWHYM
jgi:uncharacterized protein YkwD